MENKHPTTTPTNPRGVCEKLFDAITVTPGFRSLRRISYHPQDSPPSSVDSHTKTNGLHHPVMPEPVKPTPEKKVVEAIQANTPPPLPLSSKPHATVSPKMDTAPIPNPDQAQMKVKHKVDPGSQVKVHKQKSGGKIRLHGEKKEEEKKPVKLETQPPEVEGEKKGKLANINDKANDYIHRARMKIRTTTRVEGGGGEAGRTTTYK
ncbi:hypothetical protein ACHQM5_026944 [Ranunculus cassubicifolius]